MTTQSYTAVNQHMQPNMLEIFYHVNLHRLSVLDQ